jgi:CubicO group peptidase (beta-lactamase class C family)
MMDRLTGRIEDGDFGEVSSLLIIHRDNLILEKYWGSQDRTRKHMIQSCTKSITSLLVGIAVDKGMLSSLDEKVCEIFSEREIENLDERKRAITIEHLLTMTAGFEWDEWSLPYDNPQNSNKILKESEDYVKYTLDRPMAEQPGDKFVYNSGISILLGEIVKIRSGRKVADFAIEHLFSELDVQNFEWWEKNGITDCGGALLLRPIDMAKLGYLVLNKGMWGDRQLVSEYWINESVKHQTDAVSRINYGYQWWNFECALDILGDIEHASGFGGQMIFIIEELEMVIVMTGENYFRETRHSVYDLFFAILLPNPDYKTRVMEAYDRISNLSSPDPRYAGIEYMNIAYELIEYSDYHKAIVVLDILPGTENDNNWFYWFLYGKAYYHLDDRDKALHALNRHIELNKRSSLHEEAYYEWADQMLQSLGNP